MKRTLITIATLTATFAMSAASCDAPLPPAIDQIITFEDVSPCGIRGSEGIDGTCYFPAVDTTPAQPQDCNSGGICDVSGINPSDG